jgi:preprotein translocase subunit SecD
VRSAHAVGIILAALSLNSRLASQEPAELGHVRLAMKPDRGRGGPAPSPAIWDSTVKILQRRLDAVGSATITRANGGTIVVDVRSDVADADELAALAQRVGRLEFHLTDAPGRLRAALPAIDAALRRSGVPSPPVASAGSVVAQLVSPTDVPGPLSGLLLNGEQPGEFLSPDTSVARVDSLLGRREAAAAIPRGLVLRWSEETSRRGMGRYRSLYAVNDTIIIGNGDVTEAVVRRDSMSGHALLLMELTQAGSVRLCKESGRHLHDYLAIVADERVLGPPPFISDPICTNQVQLDLGDKPLMNAQYLKVLLQFGPLPTPLVVVPERPSQHAP